MRHIFERSIWNLWATSVLSDFTGFEAAELKVIVAKWRFTITNQTMHFITLYAVFHLEVRCFILVSYHISAKWKKPTPGEKYRFSLIHKREEAMFLFKYSPSFLSHNVIYNTWCAAQVTWGGMQQCVCWRYLSNEVHSSGHVSPTNKSVNHILHTSDLVGVTLSLLLATGQQLESEKEAT